MAAQLRSMFRFISQNVSFSLSLHELVLLCVLFGIYVSVATLFNKYAPLPYMDEVFHIPQTQRYCSGDWWYWDPKITTFPGLYLLGFLQARLVGLFLVGAAPGQSELQELACSVTALRATNIFLALVCMLLTRKIVSTLQPALSDLTVSLKALVLTVYPLHFFYTFMFYTDVGSLMWILAAYLASLHKAPLSCAAAAALAVLFRQTNAVWAIFILGSVVLSLVDKFGLIDDPVKILRKASDRRSDILEHCGALAIVPLLFAAFVLWNGSVVVGDKEAHKATLHLMQLLYFPACTTAFLAPAHFGLRRVRRFIKVVASFFSKSQYVRLAGAVAFLAALVKFVDLFSVAHPYLLADNRHYTFYIWRKLLNAAPYARYLPLPVYLYSLWSLLDAMRDLKQKLWVLGYAAAVALTLAPASLLELRYFTVPFFFAALHSDISEFQLILILVMFVVINIGTITVYLMYPFTWPDGSVARFMW